jgi:hypothetical protein
MGVTSVRLNQKEEKLLKLLKNYYNCDASSLLKKSLYELYEDLKDKEIIERFEKKEKKKKPQFVKFEDLM